MIQHNQTYSYHQLSPSATSTPLVLQCRPQLKTTQKFFLLSYIVYIGDTSPSLSKTSHGLLLYKPHRCYTCGFCGQSYKIFIAMNVLIIYRVTIPDCSMEWPLYRKKKCPVEHLSHTLWLFTEILDADCASFGIKVLSNIK